MRKILLFLSLIFSCYCYSQSETKFTLVEKVPVYPGCNEELSNHELKRCLSQKITNHVSKHFNIDIASKLGLDGIQNISVMFQIDTNGNIVNAKAKGPDPKLEKEAIRVINLLPKVKPGTQEGKPVTVPYSLPIRFNVENTNTQSFPVYKNCNEKLSYVQQKECTIKKISNFIKLSFDTEMASKLFPQDQSTNFKVEFTVNKKGKVEKINAKAHKREIAIEAIRVLKRLPKFKKPGFINGKPVDTPFSFMMTIYFPEF